jgi:hypothetical protein
MRTIAELGCDKQGVCYHGISTTLICLPNTRQDLEAMGECRVHSDVTHILVLGRGKPVPGSRGANVQSTMVAHGHLMPLPNHIRPYATPTDRFGIIPGFDATHKVLVVRCSETFK